MKICYVDESGDTGTLQNSTSPVQPVLAIAGIVIDQRHVAKMTQDFIDLKCRFSPHAARSNSHRLNMLLHEMKGTDLRRQAISPSRRTSRRAMLFISETIALLENVNARIFGRVWIKKIGYPMDSVAVFTSSMQAICGVYQNYLSSTNTRGIVIADFRSPGQNVSVAHAICTQKYKANGDRFDRIMEMPTFGHSNNHVGLQIADLICSAYLYPVGCYAFCTGHVNNLHVRSGYKILRDQFGPRLRVLQHRYSDGRGRWSGGITVSDDLGQKSGAHLFSDLTLPIAPTSVSAAPSIN